MHKLVAVLFAIALIAVPAVTHAEEEGSVTISARPTAGFKAFVDGAVTSMAGLPETVTISDGSQTVTADVNEFSGDYHHEFGPYPPYTTVTFTVTAVINGVQYTESTLVNIQ